MNGVVRERRVFSTRTAMTFVITMVVVATSAVFTYFHIRYQIESLIARADSRLLIAAELSRELVGPNFHDGILDENSVPADLFRAIVARNDDLCRRLDLQYLWSVLVIDGGIVFTTATHSNLDDPTSACASFFETHRDPSSFAAALGQERGTGPGSNLRAVFSSFRNEWGEGRQILVPRTDALGRIYIFAASVQLTTLNKVLLATSLTSIGIASAILFAVFFFVLVWARSFTAPIDLLSGAASRMATGDLDLPLEPAGTLELRSLSRSLDGMRLGLKQSMEALRESEARYRMLTESMKDVVWTLDCESLRFLYVSPSVERLRGYTPLEIIAEPMDAALSPGSRKDLHDLISARAAELLAGKITPETYYRDEVEQTCKDGSLVWTEVITHYWYNPATRKVELHGVTREISDRKKAEATIARLYASLEKKVRERTAQLEEANGDLEAFSRSVSHDLRAPLRSIEGFAQLLLNRSGASLDSEGLRYISVIQNNARSMDLLIAGLLNLARLGRNAVPENTVDMGALVASILQEDLSAELTEGFSVELGPLHEARGDRTLLRQVWFNLLSNAVKYSQKSDVQKIEIGSSREAGRTVYFVRDWGAGFDPDSASRLFHPFQRLHASRDYEGIGVGLAIVHKIIQQHGGAVWAEGEVGKGACFHFSLPLGDAGIPEPHDPP